jgi:hypothetical protein
VSKSDELELALLQLLYLNSVVASNVLDSLGSGLQAAVTPGSIYVGLHTGDVGEAGDQTTNEAGYTSYARQAVARSAAGWTASTNQVTNFADVTFPSSTGGTETLTHWSTGTDLSGTGHVLHYGGLIDTARVFVAAASTDVVTSYSHGFNDTDQVVVYGVVGATSLPTGISHGGVYFVRDSTTHTFKLALTSGGAAIDLTTDGGGYIGLLSPLPVVNGTQPKIPATQLKIYLG